MTPGAATSAFLDDLSRLGTQQWLIRIVMLLGTLIVVAAEVIAGAALGVAYPVAVLVLALLVVALPDSSVGLFLMLVMAWHWTARVPDATSGWLLMAALGLLVLHVGGILASYGPSQLVLEGSLVRQWAVRAGQVAAVTVLVWFGVRFVSVLDLPASGLLFGAALTIVAGWSLMLGRQVSASHDG